METEYKKTRRDRIKIQDEKLGMLPKLDFKENVGLYKQEDFDKYKIFFTYNRNETFHSALKTIKEIRMAGSSADHTFLDYSEKTLSIPETGKGLVCHNEQGTIICVVVPRSVSLTCLTKKTATNQAVLFKQLLKELPDQPRGKKSHSAITDQKYVIAGVTVPQRKGLNFHMVGKIPEKLPPKASPESEKGKPTTPPEPAIGKTEQSDSHRDDCEVVTSNKRKRQGSNQRVTDDSLAPKEDPVRVWISGLDYSLYTKLSLLRVARRCEQLARRFIPIAEHRALYEALKLANTPVAQTFWDIYSSCAMGTDFQAAMHTDFDAFFSILIVHSIVKGDNHPLLSRLSANLAKLPAPAHHFIFPTFGLAIQLRPGDHFFFNPLFIHGCSAKLPEYQQSNVSLMAFYLKAACVDGHDADDIQLTDYQQEMVEHYKKFLESKKQPK